MRGTILLALLPLLAAQEVAAQSTPVARESSAAKPIVVARAERQRVRQRRRPRQRQRWRARPVRRRPARTRPKRLNEPPPPPARDSTGPWGIAVEREHVKHFHVLFTSDVFGRYAWPGCEGRPKGRADMSHLAAAVKKRSKEITDAQGSVVTVAAGSMVRPDVLGSYVFDTDPTLALTAIDLIKSVGFSAITLGLFDLGVTQDGLKRYMRLLNKAGVPLTAGNIQCQRKDAFPCAHLGRRGKRYVIEQRGDVKVGIFSVLRDDLIKRVMKRGRGGLQAEDAVEFARRTITKLRTGEKVDLVVLLANVNVEADTPLPVLDFIRRLGEDGPDLVVANAMWERASENFVAQVRQGHGPLIVGTDRFGQTMGEAVFYYRRDKNKQLVIDRAVVHRHRVAEATPDPVLDKKARSLIEGLCEALDRPLGASVVKRTLTYPGFMSYLMNIMRNNTRAEIGLLNDSAVADTPFPMSGKLTKEMVLRAIRTESHVGSVWMKGAEIAEQLEPHIGGRTGLHILGAEKRNGKWYVNGRGLLPSAKYRVAMSAFLASGGDLLVSPGGAFDDSGTTLRKMVIDFLSNDGPSYDGDNDIDPEADFPDPRTNWVLYGGVDATVGMYDSVVRNGFANKRHSRPNITQYEVTGINVDTRLTIGGSSRNHQFEGLAQFLYGNSWTKFDTVHDCTPTPPDTKPAECNGGDQDVVTSEHLPWEGNDIILFTLTYRLLAMRDLAKDRDAWYAPEAYIQTTMTTELTANSFYDDDAKVRHEYRYGDWSSSVGLGLAPTPLLFGKLGFAVRRELFTPAAAGITRTTAGLYVGGVMDKWQLLKGDYPLKLETRIDFYLTDPGGTWMHELTCATRLSFSLTPRISVGINDMFYVFGRDGDTSFSNNLSLTLGVQLDYRRQTF